MNIRDVAEFAEVSIATVSRYLNNGIISEKSRAKVKHAIEHLGYTPNDLAKSIFKDEYYTIGVMVPNLSNPFYYQFVAEIEQYASSLSYSVLLSNTNDNRDKEIKSLQVYLRNRVAGIIASRSRCNIEYNDLKVPVVAFEDKIGPNIPTVSTDNYEGGRAAFRHLYECGARKMLHVTGPELFSAVNDRMQGFSDAAMDCGLNIDIVYMNSDFKTEMAHPTSNHFLNDVDWKKYDGVFVFNDIASAAVMRCIKLKGFRIPEDIQLVSFDNSFLCDLLSPQLTSFSQPISAISKALVDSLLIQMKGQSVSPMDCRLTPKLVQRESTRIKHS